MFDPIHLLVLVAFVVMLSVLVVAHELGHYWAARLCGMGVEEFAVGMGKKVATLGRKRHVADGVEGETEFTLRALPIGGFVRPRGMEPKEDGSETSVPGGFYAKGPLARLIVLGAGPLFSVLAGVALIIGVYTWHGAEKFDNAPVLGRVSQNDPADKAGLKPGDRLLEVDGKKIETFYEFLQIVQSNAGNTLEVRYSRNGETRTTKLTPVKGTVGVWRPNLELSGETKEAGKIGAAPQIKHEKMAFVEAVREGFRAPVTAVTNLVGLLKKPANLADSVGGPGTIVKMTNDAVRSRFVDFVALAAMLSISFGIFNLLPVPPLDGGQMVVAFAELLRGGRRLSFQVQSAVAMVGFVFVGILLVSVIAVDVKRLSGAGAPTASQGQPAPTTEPAAAR
jgi:regulator of sigma E protease